MYSFCNTFHPLFRLSLMENSLSFKCKRFYIDMDEARKNKWKWTIMFYNFLTSSIETNLGTITKFNDAKYNGMYIACGIGNGGVLYFIIQNEDPKKEKFTY